MAINKPHKYLITISIAVLLMCISNSLSAQSAYHGGKGDGYASAEIQNVVLNINTASPQAQVVSLYPNPIKSSQNLQIMMSQSAPFHVEITNLFGQVVFRKFYNDQTTNIPLSGCQPGCYIVSIENGDFKYIQKLVIIAP